MSEAFVMTGYDYERFFDRSADLLCVAGSDGEFLKVNRRWKEVLGFEANEIEGQSFAGFVHPEDAEPTLAAIRMVKPDQPLRSFANRFRTVSGDYCFLEWNINRFDEFYFCSARNLTREIGTQAKLAESDHSYRFLPEQMSDVLWCFDTGSSRFTYMSPTVESILGYTVEEVLAKKFEEMVTQESLSVIEEKLPAHFRQFLRQGINTPEITQIEMITKSGETIWTEAVTTFNTNKPDKLELIGVSRNITQRVAAEKRVKEQNEILTNLLVERNKFFSILAHDLKSPFHILLGFSDILLDSVQEGDHYTTKDMSIRLHTIVRSIYELLINLLEWANLQRDGVKFLPTKIRLSDTLAKLLTLYEHKTEAKALRIVNKIGQDKSVFADPHMLETVLRNLFYNAIKFTPRGGSITLDARRFDSVLEISVSDTGIGMPDQLASGVFSLGKFSRRQGTESEESTGLGLILCKEYVERNGGTIRFETEENKGTKFIFTVPAND